MPRRQKGIFMTVRNLIATADLYGSPVSFNVGGEGESKSVFGAIVTVASIVLTITLSLPTIENVINMRNPNIVLDFVYNTRELIGVNSTNLFMAYSFFEPVGEDKKFSNTTNNYTAVKTINKFDATCLHNCTNKTFELSKCKEGEFDDITSLKGLSTKSAQNVTDIFKTYAYCMPPNISGDLFDNDPSRSDFVASLKVEVFDTYLQPTTNARRELRKI